MSNNAAVVDPRFAAGRGEEFSAARRRLQEYAERTSLAELDGDDFRLPLTHRVEEAVDDLSGTGVETRCIPETNVGYKLLMKLGWTPGSGLGRDGKGIAEPVRLDANDTGTRTGLGRAQVDRQYYAAENVQRRALETEVQAFEDEDRTRRREVEAERQQKIREDVAQALQTFYCAICNKQYASAMELEGHLSSYDHHHKKRLQETQQMLAEQKRKSRGKKERRQAEREQAKLEEQIRAARRAAGGDSAPPTAPLPPPIPPLQDPAGLAEGEAAPLEPLNSPRTDGVAAAPPGGEETQSVPPAPAFSGWHQPEQGPSSGGCGINDMDAAAPLSGGWGAPQEGQVAPLTTLPAVKLGGGRGFGGGGAGIRRAPGKAAPSVFGDESSDGE